MAESGLKRMPGKHVREKSLQQSESVIPRNCGSMSKDKRKEFLGIDPSTAQSRLKKLILFKYIKLANDHYCFVCSLEIISHEHLTIEHKQPWERRDNGVALFWDLDNIAFSHSWCNRPHIYRSGVPELIGPEGTSWCPDCKEFLPVNSFYKNKTARSNGLKVYCKTHDKLRDTRVHH